MNDPYYLVVTNLFSKFFVIHPAVDGKFSKIYLPVPPLVQYKSPTVLVRL